MGAVDADPRTADEHRGRRGGPLRVTQAANVRQHQFLVGDNWPARQDGIAEVVPQLGMDDGGVIDPGHPERIGNAPRSLRIHLLQHDDVGIGQRRPRLEHVDRPVDVLAPLDVVGDYMQHVAAGRSAGW